MKKKKDFNGYVWGWITNDGVRNQPGTASKVKTGSITGIWGRLFRKGRLAPCYRETFLGDGCLPTFKTLERLQNLNLQQCMLFAYPENAPVAEDLPVSVDVETKEWQLWKCNCGHTFYREPGKADTWKLKLKKKFTRNPDTLPCEVCDQRAVKSKLVRKRINQGE